MQRYSIKHFIFRRNDDRVYEIPQRDVEIVDAPLLWPAPSRPHRAHEANPVPDKSAVHTVRVLDRDIIGEFFEGVRPFSSERLGLYWRGPLEVVDGSKVQVVLVEDASSKAASYSVVLREPGETLTAVAEELGKLEFPSARAALITTERNFNRVLHEHKAKTHREKSSE